MDDSYKKESVYIQSRRIPWQCSACSELCWILLSSQFSLTSSRNGEETEAYARDGDTGQSDTVDANKMYIHIVFKWSSNFK